LKYLYCEKHLSHYWPTEQCIPCRYDAPDAMSTEEDHAPVEASLSSDTSKDRKETPVFTGVLMYFPDAINALARHSRMGGEKHAPGQPLHWAKEKSKDHADCIARHLIDIGPNWDAIDEETGSYHAAALAWRALALLQTLLEREKAGKK